MTSEQYNEKVWSSKEILAAKQALERAIYELDHGKGWGRVALWSSLNEIKTATDLIHKMEHMDEGCNGYEEEKNGQW